MKDRPKKEKTKRKKLNVVCVYVDGLLLFLCLYPDVVFGEKKR